MSPWAGVPLAALCDAELAEEARLRIGPSRVREVIRGQGNKGPGSSSLLRQWGKPIAMWVGL